jgi:DMSO/TMAO reductase YedYZ molybdopterin-dependent catalytic subunit
MKTRILLTAMLALTIAFLSTSSLFIFSKLRVAAQDPPEGSEWTLLVDGSMINPVSLTYEEILALPKTTLYAELYCVDYPSSALFRGSWTGVRLGFLLEKVQFLSDAFKVAFHANDGYASDLLVTTAMREDIIIAYELNGQPLPEKLRLVVPGKWGYKWVSQLVHIELVNYDFKGTYESSGYSDEAEMPLLPADLNKDGKVDIHDLRMVTTVFGSNSGDPNWDKAADLDRTGWVNILDVTIVAKNYGRTAPASTYGF